MELEFLLKINKGRIADLLCSAVEGAWFLKECIELHSSHAPNGGISEEDLSTVSGWEDGQFCYIYPLFGDGYIRFDDIYEDKATKYYLNYDMIQNGLKVFAEKYPGHFNDWLSEDDDAITGSIFLQCCLFGHEKYG
jgi:hypothetical protein